jgi:hypothetical protein
MESGFITFSGYINIAAGLALIIYWYAFAIFMPYGQLSTTLGILVKNRNWTWINALGVFGALAGLLGQAGIYVFQGEQATIFSSIGFYIAVTGTTFLIGTMLWETVLWPILVEHDESLLSFQGPIYTSKIFFPFFVVAGLIYGAGYILVGIGIIRADILPPVTGYLIAIGAPTFALGSLFGKFQVYPRSIGVTLMSIGLVIIGLALVS